MRGVALGAMLVSLAVGLTSVAFGLDAFASPGGEREFPPAPYFIFGSVALLAGVSDLRMIRTGGFRGARRLARHLWRMCVALLIAAISFFGGQADTIPEPLRIPALLALPAPTVLLVMLYYLWRVRIRRTYRGNLGAGSHGELEWQTASTKHHKNDSGCWAAVRGARNCAERSVRTAWR